MAIIGIIVGLIGAAVGILMGAVGGLFGLVVGLLGASLGLLPHLLPAVLIVIGVVWLLKGSNSKNVAPVSANRGPASPRGPLGPR